MFGIIQLEFFKEAEKKCILSSSSQTQGLCSHQHIPNATKGFPIFRLPTSSLSPCYSHRGPRISPGELISHAESQTLSQTYCSLTRCSGIHVPLREVLVETQVDLGWKPYACSVSLGVPWLLLSLAFSPIPTFLLCFLRSLT